MAGGNLEPIVWLRQQSLTLKYEKLPELHFDQFFVQKLHFTDSQTLPPQMPKNISKRKIISSQMGVQHCCVALIHPHGTYHILETLENAKPNYTKNTQKLGRATAQSLFHTFTFSLFITFTLKSISLRTTIKHHQNTQWCKILYLFHWSCRSHHPRPSRWLT